MGIRIEDSVCVQDEHPLVLTTEAVKEVPESLSLDLCPTPANAYQVDDIEALRP